MTAEAYFESRWQASHAYSLLAVVQPTTFTVGSHTWVCTTAGTTASSEPTWPDPTTGTTTVTDGTVTWSVGTGYALSIVAGWESIMGAFSTANPTIVRKVYSERPRSFAEGESPCVFLGDMSERVSYSAGLRTRQMIGMAAYWVDRLTEQQEASARATFARDALLDYFTANFHAAGAPSGFEVNAVNDFEFPEGGNLRFPALQFVFGPNTSIAEGRS